MPYYRPPQMRVNITTHSRSKSDFFFSPLPAEVKFLKINISSRHVLARHIEFQRHQPVSPICCRGTKTLCLPAEYKLNWAEGRSPDTCPGRAGNELSLLQSLEACEGKLQPSPSLPPGRPGCHCFPSRWRRTVCAV